MVANNKSEISEINLFQVMNQDEFANTIPEHELDHFYDFGAKKIEQGYWIAPIDFGSDCYVLEYKGKALVFGSFHYEEAHTEELQETIRNLVNQSHYSEQSD